MFGDSHTGHWIVDMIKTVRNHGMRRGSSQANRRVLLWQFCDVRVGARRRLAERPQRVQNPASEGWLARQDGPPYTPPGIYLRWLARGGTVLPGRGDPIGEPMFGSA